ncbi:MAG: polymer-forming cytoskeletal protein [Paracoccaceae bacterium]|nr:polymer-forming cytoskeletal protein [Paracoccaceae bacterium]
MISTIRKDILIDGDVTAAGDIIVHGQINGNVNARSLKVEVEGSVFGNMTAQSVVSSGTTKGRIDALMVSLRAGSNTESEIFSNTLQVEISAIVNGKCHISVQPDTENLKKSNLGDPERDKITKNLD